MRFLVGTLWSRLPDLNIARVVRVTRYVLKVEMQKHFNAGGTADYDFNPSRNTKVFLGRFFMQ